MKERKENHEFECFDNDRCSSRRQHVQHADHAPCLRCDHRGYVLHLLPPAEQEEEAEMRKNAQVGDEITTIGGICGRIIAVKDETDSVIIETGSDRARLRIKRWAIGSVDTIHEEDA